MIRECQGKAEREFEFGSTTGIRGQWRDLPKRLTSAINAISIQS